MKETMEDKEMGIITMGTVCQCLPMVFTILKLFVPEAVLLTGKEVIVDLLSSFMDPKLIPWIVVLNIYGHWVKKLKSPKWAPPLPVQILALSFVICSLFGWAHTDAEGAKAMIIAIMDYGIVNGILIAFFATFGYDVWKGFSSRRKEVKA